MAATGTRAVRRAWPIVYDRPAKPNPRTGTGVAWALFLGLGLPFVLMAVLTVLARAGIYVDLFKPLWQPWPPDLLKPFLGLGVFAVTLAYLAFRVGKRSGFRSGTAAGMASVRTQTEAARPAPDPGQAVSTTGEAETPPPPPPPADESGAWDDLDALNPESTRPAPDDADEG